MRSACSVARRFCSATDGLVRSSNRRNQQVDRRPLPRLRVYHLDDLVTDSADTDRRVPNSLVAIGAKRQEPPSASNSKARRIQPGTRAIEWNSRSVPEAGNWKRRQ